MIQAFVTTAPGEVKCMDLPEPPHKKGNILVKFETGLLGAGTRRAVLGDAAQVVEGGFKYPFTIGCTAVGTVKDAGGSARMRPGDRVLISNVITCGTCAQCVSGADNLCKHRKLAGIDYEGTFSEYLSVDERRAFPLSVGMNSRMAIQATEVAVLVNALEMGWQATETRHRVTIIGAGNLGIHGVWMAREWGANEIHVVDSHPGRLDLARAMGAEVTMFPDEYDVWVNANIKERGAGVVLVVTDHPNAISQGCRSAVSRGCVVCVGLPEGGVGLITNYYPNLISRELMMRGCYSKTGAQIEKALRLLDAHGGQDFEDVVDIPISEAGVGKILEFAYSGPNEQRYMVTNREKK